MLKVNLIEDLGIIKITPPTDDFNCISSNIFFLINEGILIDAGGQYYSEEIEEIIKKYRNLKAVLLTHLHADHFGKIQDVPIYCSKQEIEYFKRNPEEALWTSFTWKPIEGEEIKVGLQARLLGDYSQCEKRLIPINNNSFKNIEIIITKGIHSISGVIYIYNNLCFIGDLFAPYDYPSINNEFKSRNSLIRMLLKKFGRDKIFLGHDKDYFENKEIKRVNY